MTIKNILISQPAPTNSSPYAELISKYGVNVDFHPLFTVEGVTAREFRASKVNILDYTAIVFTSKIAIDAFFRICEETRVTVPETMKYFCQSELIAQYLQTYIVYRKRKIFFGSGTLSSMVDNIGAKHKGENFLIACTDGLRPDVKKLFTKAKLKHGSAVFVKTVSSDLRSLDLDKYQMVVFYSPSDVKSLFESYPEFRQGSLLFATYGSTTAKAMKDAKLKTEIEAPTPEAPSIAKALLNYFEKLH